MKTDKIYDSILSDSEAPTQPIGQRKPGTAGSKRSQFASSMLGTEEMMDGIFTNPKSEFDQALLKATMKDLKPVGQFKSNEEESPFPNVSPRNAWVKNASKTVV